jgi:phosphatidylserine decarboxylase
MPNIVKPERKTLLGRHRVGGWLPNDHTALQKYISHVVKRATENPPQRSTSVAVLEQLINNDPEIYMLFNEMLTEVPRAGIYKNDPSGRPEIRDTNTLLDTLDTIIVSAPFWNSSQQIGTPINAILAWPMATTAGFAAFLKDDVNHALEGILQAWGAFLTSPASTDTLNADDGGWFSTSALNSPHMKNFVQDYVCDPTKPFYGYVTWDDFFTRSFRAGVRPVSSQTDDSIITSAAESWPFSYQTKVNLVDDFWVKGQPYSLKHMLNNDPRAAQFAGGTVYQAFLAADCYHCWHAPVSGTIVDFQLVPGTYYSEPVLYSFNPDEEGVSKVKEGGGSPDPGADADSQGYISAVAARGLIWIQADNPAIGLMCMVVIGMAEVSSIDLTAKVNSHVNKGDKIGMFHFGGSTHCLVFGPKVNLTLNPDVQAKIGNDDPDLEPVEVCSTLLTVG